MGQDVRVVRIEQTSLGETIVLDRPERRNALTLPMWRALGSLVRSADERGRAEAATPGAGAPSEGEPLYVVGAGGYFCSGADLGALRWARESPEHADDFVSGVVECLLSLHTTGREVVAVVEGGAAGGGVEIMLACDRRVAIGAPSLVFPFGTHGMTLDDLTRWRLHQLVGADEAERLVDGRHVVACEEALALGLLDGRYDTLEDLAAAEAARRRDAGGPGVAAEGESYLRPGETPEQAVRRAAAPMRGAFPPHTGS